MKLNLIPLCLLVLFLASSCTQITQVTAEAKATIFVKDRVKFYTKNNGSELDYPAYILNSVNSYKEDSRWVVVIQITRSENQSKKTDVVVELDARNGKIIKFNNQSVNYP